MGIFTKKSSIGLAWSGTGECWGVHLRRSADRCVVTQFWHSTAVGGKSAAARMSEGFHALRPQEHTTVVAGGDGSRASFVDMTLPKLPVADLRNALSFELGKHTPVAADKLVWGFRIIDRGEDGSHVVRLVFMRETEWSRWLEHVSGLGPAVDAIIPPFAVLDPLLAGHAVFFPANTTGVAAGFLLKPLEGRGREVVPMRGLPTAATDAPQALLALPFLERGGLGRLSDAEQLGYNAALLLALYGLTHGPEADRKTWVPVPFELRPRRHRYSRLLAVGLSAYIAALLVLGLGRWYRSANDTFQRLKHARQQTERQIEQLRADSNTDEFLAAVARELDDAAIMRPSLAAVLVELTRLIDPSAWVQLFDWNDGKIDLQLQAATEDAGLIQRLESSPILGDVVPGQRTVDAAGQVTIRLQMNARFDRDVEPLSRSLPTAGNAADAASAPSEAPEMLPPPAPPPGAEPLENYR